MRLKNHEAEMQAREREKLARWRVMGRPEAGYMLSTDDEEGEDA